jgi:putative transposase
MLPKEYGPKSTIYDNFAKWTSDKIFRNTWEDLINEYQERIDYDVNLTLQIIDTTTIKSINGYNCIGKNPTDRGRNATKLSLSVDKVGTPIGYCLAEASIHDSKLFEPTLKATILKSNKRVTLLADKGYSSNKSKQIAKKYGMNLICPNKKNFRKPIFKKDVKSKKRYIVEASNSWIKQFRRLRLRYDGDIINYESFVLLAFCIITIRKMDI